MGKRLVVFCDVCGGNLEPGTGAQVKISPYLAGGHALQGDVCGHCLDEKELNKLPVTRSGKRKVVRA